MLVVDFLNVVVVAGAVSAVSVTLSRSKMFTWLRESPRLPKAVRELLACPYCLSHWIAAVFSLVLVPDIVSWVIVSFAVVGFSALLTGLVGVLLHQHQKLIDELKSSYEEQAMIAQYAQIDVQNLTVQLKKTREALASLVLATNANPDQR